MTFRKKVFIGIAGGMLFVEGGLIGMYASIALYAFLCHCFYAAYGGYK